MAIGTWVNLATSPGPAQAVARPLVSTLESMATPCTVKAQGR